MKNRTNRRMLAGCILIVATLVVVTVIAVAQPQVVGKEKIEGESTVTTSHESGTVLHVEGNNVVVKLSTGEVRSVAVDPNRKFLIDGKETTVAGLKPGTTLSATYTTTTTPVTERTTTAASGKVWYANGPTVIITYPNGENRQYTIKEEDNIQFKVDGQPASVYQLKKGMNVSATKIVEDPSTVMTKDSVVTGRSPATRQAAAPAPRPAPAPARKPAPAPRPAPTQVAQATPAALPATASPLPLIGILGFVALASAGGIRLFRNRLN